MKNTATTVLKIAVSLGILALILNKVDTVKLLEELRTAHVLYAVAAVVVYFIVQALSAYRWYLLLRPVGVEAPYTRILSYYLLGMYFNWFLPTAIGGDAVKVYYLRKEAATLSRATASVFLDRDIGMAALLSIATIVAAVAGTTFEGVPLAPIFLLISIMFALANLALFYRPSYNLLHRLLSLFRMKRVDERVEHMYESFNSYRREWGLLGMGLVLSLIIQVGGVFANILLAYAIGLETRNGWIDFLVFIPAISLISMNPLSVAGTGWREIAYKVFFESVGATESQAVAFALMWLGVLVATSLPGGIIYVLRSSGGKERLPSAEVLEASASDRAEVDDKIERPETSGTQREEKPLSTV